MKKITLVVLMVFVVSEALLAIPQMINFQGRILEDGKPVNGAKGI